MPKHADGRLYPKHWPHRRWQEQCVLSVRLSKQRASLHAHALSGLPPQEWWKNNRFCTPLTQRAHKRCAATSYGLNAERRGDGQHRLCDLHDLFVLVHGAFTQCLPGRLFTETVLLHQPVLGLFNDPALIK